MKSSVTNQISIKEIKNLDTSKIKSFQLLDGSIILINNSKSSQDEQNLINQPRPLFTRVDNIESSQHQLQYNTSQQNSGVQKCTRCHRIKQSTASSQNQNVQSYEANVSQPLTQTEDTQNYQYYEQNLNMEQNKVENQEQQQLKNDNGQNINEMITYNEQEGGEYYGEEQGEEGFEQNQNEYAYEGQQNENYYMDQQAYGQNAEGVGMEQGGFYQQAQEQGYEQQQEYQDENAYQENQYQGYEQEQQGENLEIEKKQEEEINTDIPKVTVEEIITMEVKEDDQKEQNEQQNEEEKEPNEEKQEEHKENEDEKDMKIENKEDNQENEANNNIEGKDNLENKELDQQQEKEYEEKIEEKEQHEEQKIEENIENMEKSQNQEEFKETEYKGDEEAEAEVKQENSDKIKNLEKKDKEDNKKEKKDKKRKPKLEQPGTETNINYPRPRVPVTKIEYVEYILPKKKINPFPTLPIRFLLQDVKKKMDSRSHSHSNTYHPSFGRERFGFMPLPRRPVPMFRPMPFEIPPRPPKMTPMPPFEMLINEGMRPMPSVSRRFPQGPMPGPRFPPRLHPRPFHFPPPPPSRPQPFYNPPRPQTGFNSYYNQTRRFFGGNEGMDFSRIHPHPHPYPYQRYVYPPPQRRFAEFYKNYEPEETVNRTEYFVEKNNQQNRKQQEQEDYELGLGRESYYTYSMGGPRRNRTTRSVSSGRSNGRFTFNFGRTQPIRSMFKRVNNRRLERTKKPKIITVNYTQGNNYGEGNSSRSAVRRVYQFQN